MKKITLALLIILSTISMSAQFRVVGYLPSYRWVAVNAIDYNTLTHVCYSFANPDALGNFSFTQDVSKLIAKTQPAGIKVFASIGGGAVSAQIETAYRDLTKPAALTGFVNKLMNYLRATGVDGVDVDLEGNLVQMSTYNAFVIELADSIHAEGMEISAALANWTKSYVSKDAADALDFINLMSYDQTGSWSGPGPHSTYSAAVNDYNYWKNTKGQAANKIVLGLPFYGYEFQTGGPTVAWTWCDIVQSYPDKLEVDQLSTPSGELYYNGTATIQKKTQFMMDQNAGGVMIWELAQDCFGSNSLMNIIATTMDGTIGLEETSVLNDVNVYPNPAKNTLNINVQVDSYKILSIAGELLLSGNDNQINIEPLLAGTYLIEIVAKNTVKSTVFIKN